MTTKLLESKSLKFYQMMPHVFKDLPEQPVCFRQGGFVELIYWSHIRIFFKET